MSLYLNRARGGVRISGAHVVITGASRGLGSSLAEIYAARGARLTLVARNAALLEKVAERTGAVALPVDLSDLDAVDGLVPRAEEKHGPVDILVNNAAINLTGPFVKRSKDELRQVLHTNIVAPLELTRTVLPGMIERGSGAVVNVSSLGGEVAIRNVIPYCAAKAGLAHATYALQRELRGTNVLLQLVVLGLVDTDMAEALHADPVSSALHRRFAVIRPIPSLEVAEKMANAVERGRKAMAIPAVATPMTALRQLPTRFIDLTMSGSPKSEVR